MAASPALESAILSLNAHNCDFVLKVLGDPKIKTGECILEMFSSCEPSRELRIVELPGVHWKTDYSFHI
jgi:hypothetical protein